MRKDIFDILGPCINAMTFPIVFTSIHDMQNGTWEFIGICNTHHAQLDTFINLTRISDHTVIPSRIRSLTDSVITIEIPSSIQVEGIGVQPIAPLYLQPPYFFHGTPKAANAEFLKLVNSATPKYPFIYIMENFTENDDYTYQSIIERSVSFQIFFLTKKGKQVEIVPVRNNYIKPMENLYQDFENMLNHYSNWGIFVPPSLSKSIGGKPKKKSSYDWGIEIPGKGNEGKTYFNDFLAGVAMNITIEFYKQSKCGCAA